MAELKTYWAKRDFTRTAEPKGAAPSSRTPSKKALTQGNRYIIQKHAARRLHYDLRLELDGVMLSWAVTRGPSLVTGEKRLAIHVEDHPVEYNSFEGTIPAGQYGGGTVMIWDRGVWIPEYDPHKGLKKGHLEFSLEGEKLKGRWHLVRLKARPGERQEPWLLMKADDDFARKPSARDILVEKPDSVVSQRSIEEIAEGASKVWDSDKPVSAQSAKLVSAEKKRAMKAGGRKAPTKKAAVAKPAAKPKTKPATKTKKVAKDKGTRAKAKAPRKSAARKSATPKAKPKAKAKPKRKSRGADPALLKGARAAALPDFVPPALATLNEKAPTSDGWVHEIKFDGYRIQARLHDGSVQLRTRTGLDWTDRFPRVANGLAPLADRSMVLDGELIAGDAHGISDFAALQEDLKSGRHDRLSYFAFDILHLDGIDVTAAPLLERKALLTETLGEREPGDPIQVSAHFETEGAVLLRHACEINLEGIICKRANAPYRSGRSRDWLKVKCTHSQEFVIAGYEPSDKAGRTVRSLLLAYYDGDRLQYAGRVGTGWGAARERQLVTALKDATQPKTPFAAVPEEERRRKVIWTTPTLVAEVEFRGWTGGTLVRQAAFKGLREDKPAKEVRREMPAGGSTANGNEESAAMAKSRTSATKRKAVAPASRSAAGKKGESVAGVPLTHPERVYWNDAGVTKLDLARYYEQVWDWMAPHVAGRVLSLVRCPDGQTGACFYQKHASAGMDDKRLQRVKEPDGEVSIAIDDLAGLVSLAQAGVLEVHVRGSTVEHLEEADRLVFDLDPGPGVAWSDVIAGARDVKAKLEDLGLTSFVKTTGGKGLHVVVPIKPAPWDAVKAFCREVAEAMAGDAPDRYTATIKKTARKNRIFLDYLRNSREATAIAPYSTRARPGATVSVPVTWAELARLKEPSPFNVSNVPARLKRMKTDPWAEIATVNQSLPGLKLAAKPRKSVAKPRKPRR